MQTNEYDMFYSDMAEVCLKRLEEKRVNCQPSSSSVERPFKLLVKNEVFTVDSKKLSKLSPIFALMCYGRDFEGGRELAREIVDENSSDIATFLQCLQDHHKINEWNVPVLLRLSNKYQVESLTKACCSYLETTNLENVKPDQVLTLLISAHDHHLPKSTISPIILRLAQESRTVYTRLRLNRFLPANLYTAVIATNMNLTTLGSVAKMNGHFFRIDRNSISYKKALCSMCKKIVDSAECEGCKLTLCQNHWQTAGCHNEFGKKMLAQLKEQLVDVELDY
ncbi:unnamed protein product [Bursaphelenchus okinawaensis]|uniref:BTB domain-containing protein n=1 Tax=Bursaphelenchus okinawaensis TaxID=465554 RepID=A0A811K6Y4_9BILA|nr:unnamed protein product [Bursaphelenchus okinawaensis]CAG9092805.1 unnamed protein product [Bursaphelenchus okinawaensis]